MNIKPYIDQFEELRPLPRHEQFDVLEQAVAQYVDTGPLSVYALLGTAFPVLLIATVCFIGYGIWGFFPALPVIAILVGLVVSRVIAREVTNKMIHQAVQKAVQQRQL